MNKENEKAVRAMLARVTLRKRLTELWGPEESWPVSWDDVTPSIQIWVSDEASDDDILGYVLECVKILGLDEPQAAVTGLEVFETDVQDYIDSNPRKFLPGTKAQDLAPKEFVDAWLTWHGVIGYADDVVKLVLSAFAKKV